MEFKKYNSIENTYRDAFINRIRQEGLATGLWQVTLKIDGANFSFWCDGKDVKVARRSGFLGEGASFFGCWPIVDKYKDNILALHNTHFIENEVLVVSGELFGEGINGRVNYGKGKHFAAFDISMEGEFFSTKDTKNMCNDFNIPHVPILLDGVTLEQAMAFEVDFKDTYYPEADSENITEGVVIKPVHPKFLSNKSRVILKKKSSRFSEKIKKNTKPVAKLNDQQNKYIQDISEYINENRLKNVISKVGEVTQKDFGKILGLLMQDTLKDYSKDTNKNPKKDLDTEWKQVQNALQKDASELIRKNFVNIIDGQFKDSENF